MFIRISDDIIAKTIESEDAEAFYKMFIKDRKTFLNWFPWNDFETVESVRSLFTNCRLEYLLGIRYKGRLIGGFGFEQITRNKMAELVYWIDKDYRGRGIIPMAGKKIIFKFAQILDINRFQIEVSTINTSSIRIAEKLGFTLEGRLKQAECFTGEPRDIYVFGLTRDSVTR